MKSLHFPFLPVVLLLATVIVGTASMKEPPGLPDMAAYTHINTLVVPDSESPIHGIHHFYMNDVALKTFRQGVNGGEYPEGAIIVGKVFKPVTTEEGRIREGDLAGYTYMEKQPMPMTERTGGWRFVKYSPAGEQMGVNPVQDCFSCHEPSKETDYVLSEPLP
jgi:hypothetical protein